MGLGLACMVVWTLSAAAGVKWYAVDPMGEEPYMPDEAPHGGKENAPIKIIAARGEYEPGSFVLVADEDLGKVSLEVGDFKTEKGWIFPAGRIDLKTVKVWYQAGNAWTSYFSDPKLRLCPELLLNDEDLVKVDTKKGWNYARLTEADGSVRYQWINPPHQVDQGSFGCMKPNFRDAKTHQGATLRKGEYKQFWLTVEVGKDVRAGLYKGEVKVKGLGLQRNIPISLRVLDFELPEPKCYFDVKKDFVTWFCEYVGIEDIMKLNGNDKALAERQLVAILKDFVRHNEIIPGYREFVERPEFAREAGMCTTNHLYLGLMQLAEPAQMRYDARHRKEALDRKFGPAGEKILGWGDEYGISKFRGIRHMVPIYQDAGFTFMINSWVGYEAGGHMSDLWWPPLKPDAESFETTYKFNQLGGVGYVGWYANQHVGNENPAFCRRQYGIGPYRAGFSSNYNYAHHLDGWNDIRDFYRAMMFVYGTGDGCVDTIQWEGFREGLDDIRYATKLLQLAQPLSHSPDTARRYPARKALQLLADADGDDMDLTTLRLEMVRHIQRLMALK